MPGAHRLSIPCRYDQLPAVAAWVKELAVEMALPATLAYRLDLILAEAVTNIIEHGCSADRGQKIDLTCQGDNASLLLEIRDDACPFDPTAHRGPVITNALDQAMPNGRGIHLMKQYTSGMQYRHEGGQNILTLRFEANADS